MSCNNEIKLTRFASARLPRPLQLISADIDRSRRSEAVDGAADPPSDRLKWANDELRRTRPARVMGPRR